MTRLTIATASAPTAIQIAAPLDDGLESVDGAAIGVADTVIAGEELAPAGVDSGTALALVASGVADAAADSDAELDSLAAGDSGAVLASADADSSAEPTVSNGEGNSASDPSAGSG